MPGFENNQPDFGDQWVANLRRGGMPAGGLRGGAGAQADPGDVRRLRQERALQYYQRAFGMPHAERQNTPALSQEQIAAMIGRIRQARGM
jgi:hypothetical protein